MEKGPFHKKYLFVGERFRFFLGKIAIYNLHENLYEFLHCVQKFCLTPGVWKILSEFEGTLVQCHRRTEGGGGDGPSPHML